MILGVRTGYFRVFLAILRRDLFVSGRGLWMLMVQVGLLPLLMLFVFAKVLGATHYVDAGYGRLLLPGILALTTFMAALQGMAYPLIIDFSMTREIEDRLLAPLPTSWVAIEKLTMAAIRGMIAATVMYPIGALVHGSALWRAEGSLLLLAILLLGAWTGGAIGLTLGTLLPPTRTHVMLALIMTPMLFTGATQYPWPALDSLPWFKALTALNPLTYCSEGVRAALAPEIPHIPAAVCLVVLAAFAILFTLIGIKTFHRRAIG